MNHSSDYYRGWSPDQPHTNMQEKLYYISGLGADERVFVNLTVEIPFQKHIKWEAPSRNESLPDYCKRLLAQIDLGSPVILVGVSFGGIIAQEISKLIPVKKLIIISSIKNEKEMDWQLQWTKALKLYKLFPPSVLIFLNKITADYYFGIKSKEESKLLRQIIADSDPVFLMWAIDKIMHWSNTETIPLLHIHGTKDKIFPLYKIKKAIVIKNGGHFMVLNRANEVSLLINGYINAGKRLQ